MEKNKKTLISYQSGTGGDFITSVLNTTVSDVSEIGTVKNFSSIKTIEETSSIHDLLNFINDLPGKYIGTHLLEETSMLSLPVIFSIINDDECLEKFIYRDAITRRYDRMLKPDGTIYQIIESFFSKGNTLKGSHFYLDFHKKTKQKEMENRREFSKNKSQILIDKILEKKEFFNLLEKFNIDLSMHHNLVDFYDQWVKSQKLFTYENALLSVEKKLNKFFTE